MFKSIVSIKSVVNSNCQICSKTFCCAECRDRHVDKVHPGLNGNCALCASKALPTRQFEFEKLDLENEQLLCHIVDKHLPLRCQLCGDTFESKEDFKSFGACKWWSRHYLTSPISFGYHDKKLKRSMSDSDYNDKFYTPSEIHRKTSTPMFLGQKVNAEYATPCIPDFTLKTPKTNSSSIVQYNGTAKSYESQNSETRDTEFFSFLTCTANEDVLFKINTDDQFSGRKLNIMEERNETAGNKIATVNGNRSPIDMELTGIEGGILRDSPQLDPICEEPGETPEIVKKVRFSDERKILAEFEERMEACVKSILNTSMEEEDDVFQDAHTHASNTRDAEVKHSTKITENVKDTKCNREEDQAGTLEKSLQKLNDHLHVEIVQGNIKKDETEKENRNLEVNSLPATTSQQNTRVLMMVLVGNDSGELNGNLMPLISSGLKKLQEQVASTNYSATDTTEFSGTLRRQSVTKMQMTVSTVESISVDNTREATDYQGVVQSFSSPAQNKDERNGGFLSSFAHAVKYALKSFSGLNILSKSIEEAKEGEENVENSMVTSKLSKLAMPASSNFANNSNQVRAGKRARDTTDVSSKRDSFAFTLESRSPLAKRHRRWYTTVKGRKPIRSATSSRRLSTGTQIFSQGSLTVGDTVLPLPARAHQSTQTE